MVDKKVNDFFKKFIAEEIEKRKSSIPYFQFDSLKVWLCDTAQCDTPVGYELPTLTDKALCFNSAIPGSELTRIQVLDNGFTGTDYDDWKAACETLFVPLFQRMVAPASPPDVLKEFMVMRFGVDLSQKLNLYLDMKKNIFFDALIVQIVEASLSKN